MCIKPLFTCPWCTGCKSMLTGSRGTKARCGNMFWSTSHLGSDFLTSLWLHDEMSIVNGGRASEKGATKEHSESRKSHCGHKHMISGTQKWIDREVWVELMFWHLDSWESGEEVEEELWRGDQQGLRYFNAADTPLYPQRDKLWQQMGMPCPDPLCFTVNMATFHMEIIIILVVTPHPWVGAGRWQMVCITRAVVVALPMLLMTMKMKTSMVINNANDANIWL